LNNHYHSSNNKHNPLNPRAHTQRHNVFPRNPNGKTNFECLLSSHFSNLWLRCNKRLSMRPLFFWLEKIPLRVKLYKHIGIIGVMGRPPCISHFSSYFTFSFSFILFYFLLYLIHFYICIILVVYLTFINHLISLASIESYNHSHV